MELIWETQQLFRGLEAVVFGAVFLRAFRGCPDRHESLLRHSELDPPDSIGGNTFLRACRPQPKWTTQGHRSGALANYSRDQVKAHKIRGASMGFQIMSSLTSGEATEIIRHFIFICLVFCSFSSFSKMVPHTGLGPRTEPAATLELFPNIEI